MKRASKFIENNITFNISVIVITLMSLGLYLYLDYGPLLYIANGGWIYLSVYFFMRVMKNERDITLRKFGNPKEIAELDNIQEESRKRMKQTIVGIMDAISDISITFLYIVLILIGTVSVLGLIYLNVAAFGWPAAVIIAVYFLTMIGWRIGRKLLRKRKEEKRRIWDIINGKREEVEIDVSELE